MKAPQHVNVPGDFNDALLEAAYRMHLARRSKQVSSGVFLIMALFLITCASRLIFHESLTPRRLVVITSCSLGVVGDMWVVRLLMFDSREWLARSEVLKAWTFLGNTTLAMTTALLVKAGEIPLMSQLPLFHTVLNCIFNYLIQFPAPTGAYLQGVCLVCSFYHEFAHWTLEARQPSRFVTEMLLCILVAYVCIAANGLRDAQSRQLFLVAYRRHVAAKAAVRAG